MHPPTGHREHGACGDRGAPCYLGGVRPRELPWLVEVDAHPVPCREPGQVV